MKKLLILGLAAAMTLSLAACGGGDSKTPTASNNNNNTSSASGSQAGGDNSSLPEIEAGSCATPAVLTSVGQSADVEIVGTLCGKAGIEVTLDNTINAEDLPSDCKTLILAVGGSSKGLGAAGIDADQELARTDALLKKADELGITVVAMHTGGSARRGTLSDSFITPSFAAADVAVVVAEGDGDGLMSGILAGNSTPSARGAGGRLHRHPEDPVRRCVMESKLPAPDWSGKQINLEEGKHMTAYVITFVIMVGVFMAGCFALKLPVGVSMMIAALCGAIQGGLGLETLRMMVEGEFGYVDTILTIGCAMIFMKVIEDSGALDALSSLIIERFHKVPAVLLILIMLIIMFPGMITGSSTAAVLSAGSIMAPVLALMGIDAVTAGSIIAMGALLGMIAPPVNTAALIICAGIDVPYVGFEGPLALLTFPLAILFVLLLGYKQARHLDYEKLKPALVEQDAVRKQYGFKIYIPLVVLVVLMVVFKVLKLGEDIGMPLMFMLSAVSGLFTGKKINVLQAVPAAIRTAAPVMGILMGVGMFIEVMTATGVRGLVVISCLRLPQVLWLVACAVSIPLFGAVSSYGACSVLGVPFAYIYASLLGGNSVVVLAAISLIAAVGDMMPPTALAGLFAAQITGVKPYTKILKRCMAPIVILLVYACFFLAKSKLIAGLF